MIKIYSGSEVDKKVREIISQEIFFDRKKEEQVRAIVDDVRDNGDAAVIKYTKKFDGVTIKADEMKVTPKEINDAYKAVNDDYLRTLKTAVKNITSYHKRQKADEWFETLPDDVILGMRNVPIDRVGVYVPGGTAIYPSSVLMNVIPARVAGVREIVMATPPMPTGRQAGKGGKCDPHILVAAAEVGVGNIIKAGGCQAIAALAFGTESIPRVDKIVGPGNIYVTLAKKMVYGQVGIDKLAGPSDILIIADEDSEAEFIAADMLSQAEHDPDSTAILISTSMSVAKEVLKEISKQITKIKRSKIARASMDKNGCIFVVEGLKKAVEISNKIAPEHLEILSSPPQNLLEKIRNAGAVFLGPHSPVVVGDYMAGPNHVLPTSGSARFSSPLSVYDFIKKQSIVGFTKPALRSMLQDIKIFADVEGLDAHARSAEIRFKS
jgi:histidinol dehydrogenase